MTTYQGHRISSLGCGLCALKALCSLSYTTQSPYNQLNNSAHLQEVQDALVF